MTCLYCNLENQCELFSEKGEDIINGCDEFGTCLIENYNYSSKDCEYYKDQEENPFIDDEI